jgi:beta-glucosidase
VSLSIKEDMKTGLYADIRMVLFLTATDFGWGIYPEGLFRALKKIATLKVPIYITENGLADEKDEKRAMYIQRHLYLN